MSATVRSKYSDKIYWMKIIALNDLMWKHKFALIQLRYVVLWYSIIFVCVLVHDRHVVSSLFQMRNAEVLYMVHVFSLPNWLPITTVWNFHMGGHLRLSIIIEHP